MMIRKLSAMLAVLALSMVALPVTYADTDRGLEIAKAMKEADRGFGDFTADMEMILIDSGGKQAVRRVRVKDLEVSDDGDKSLAIFDAPADVKGTVFLSHTHITKPDDQWLYLPSLKRVKRIAPANKTAPFMGSEFSYEDLTSFEVEKYTYKYVGKGNAGGREAFLLEEYPVDEHSGYSRIVVWVDSERYIVLKAEYYDRRGDKLKTLVSSGFRQYLDRYWRASEMEMSNHQSGKRSILRWSDYRFHQNLRQQDFNPASLPRMF